MGTYRAKVPIEVPTRFPPPADTQAGTADLGKLTAPIAALPGATSTAAAILTSFPPSPTEQQAAARPPDTPTWKSSVPPEIKVDLDEILRRHAEKCERRKADESAQAARLRSAPTPPARHPDPAGGTR